MPTCSNPKCRVAQTGVCLEGHKTGCPNLIPDNPAAPTAAAPPPSLKPALEPPAPKRFYTGEKLLPHETSRFLNQYAALVVLCAGSQESGKTTFLARIGEMFRDGSFARYKFVRSGTLNGFERLTWHATINSESPRPLTKRTARSENDRFLHLRICPADDATERKEILISDMAGETFPTAVASEEVCAESLALGRADHLVLFLDCGKLINQAARHSEWDNARAFLRRVKKVRANAEALKAEVIFSRYDYVTRDSKPGERETYLERIKADLTAQFGNAFAEMKFWRIAARPETGKPTNHEIQDIFGHWLQPVRWENPPPSRHQKPARDFCAYGL